MPSNRAGSETLRGWIIAAIAVGAALGATTAVSMAATDTYLLLIVAVAISAWYGGLRAGLAAIAASIFFSQIFLIPPTLSFRIENRSDVIRLILFLGVSVLVSMWAHSEKDIKRALEVAHSRFRLVMDNVTDYAIVLLDRRGNILDWNTGAQEILGLEDSDRGRSVGMIFTPEETAAGAATEEIGGALERHDVRDERWHQRRDGTRFWGVGMLTTLRDQEGRLNGYVKIFRDFTSRKRQEEERERLTRQLEEANRAKEQVMAMLAHDLRAPLSNILGWVALKRSGKLEDPQAVDKAFDVIERNGRQQLELMETLLDVSHIRSGRVQLERRRCDVIPVLADTVETLRPSAESKRLQLEHRFEIPSMVLEADPGRLRQVFLNLISNAIKYTPEAGRVEVYCRVSNRHVEIQVADTGQGIEPDLLPHIFEPFRHGGTQDVGTGLGLAIARELVELHGGQVQAESEGAGKGSRFTVKLPFVSLPAETHGGA